MNTADRVANSGHSCRGARDANVTGYPSRGRAESRAKRFWDLFPRRGLLDKAAVEGLGEVDLGALELVVEGEKHVGGRRHAGGGSDAGARRGRLVGLDRREVESHVAQYTVFAESTGAIL